MTNPLLSTLSSSIDQNTIQRLAATIGATPAQTQSAVGAALPMMLGGLARNTEQPGGADALAGALDRNHDGTLLDSLGPLFGQSNGGGAGGLLSMAASMLGAAPGPTGQKSVDGAGILGHMFGTQQTNVESGVAKASGLDKAKVLQLLMLLAPMVMSALGKSKRQQGADAGGLAGMVQGASEQTGGGQAGGIFGTLLDKDGDGDISDDLASAVAGNLLGGLFK